MTNQAAQPSQRRLLPRFAVWALLVVLVLYAVKAVPFLVWPPQHHSGGQYWGHGPLLWLLRAANVGLVWGTYRAIRFYGRQI